jgi:AraC-like DNA-binding protein
MDGMAGLYARLRGVTTLFDTADDEARFWRSAEWPGLELMQARWVRHSFPRHAHDCYTIGVNVTGRGAFDCRGRGHAAWPGTLNLIAPGEAHTGRASGARAWAYVDFYVDPDRMRALAEQAGVLGVPAFRSPSVHDPELARRFSRAFAEMTVMPSARLERESRLISALRTLLSRHAVVRWLAEPGERGEPRASARVRDYLRAHHAEEIPVTALAALVGWSPYHLIRVFHHDIGMPPHAYQNTLRVGAAQELLQRGTPIVEVAAACGFCDQSHMNRVFRRVLGTTPGRYSASGAIPSKT